MAKQTFTTGQVLTAAQMTSLQQTAMGGGSATAKTASYVLVAADAGTTVAMNAAGATTITVNTALFAAGDTVFIQNLGAGVCTITAGTATVATSGSLVLAQNQGGELYFTSASAAVFFQYATPASSGDIEGVTAGTGISGGGTSGTVTVTNSMATAIDAKGDLVVGTGADTFSRLAVGTNTHILTADSAEATGLKWTAPSAGGASFVGCRLSKTSSQSITTSTYTAITFQAEVFDTDAFHDNTTNNTRITIPTGKGGYYLFIGKSNIADSATNIRVMRFFKNGATQLQNIAFTGRVEDTPQFTFSTIANLTAGDYVELSFLQNSGSSLDFNAGGATDSEFSCQFLGA